MHLFISRKKILSLALLVVIFLLAVGCTAKVKADISSYETASIEIHGLKSQAFTVSPKELAQMDCKKETVTWTTAKKKVEVEAIGPTLETLAKSYDKDLTDYQKVVFTATDGYVKVFKREFFVTHPDLILSLASGKEPLPKEDQPLRLVIPGATPDNWVKGVVRIEFIP
ncbi:MAG: molybdopterin-dependent oxidoreductase [Anaerovoracaceae bacterium]